MMKDISKGFKKMLQNKSDSGELEEMLDMLQDEQYATLYATLIAEELAAPVAEGAISPELRERLDLRLKQILAVVATEELPSPKYSLRLKLAAVWPVAAAVAVAIATSVFYFNTRKPAAPPKPLDLYSYNKAHDIGAGTNKAILTLANGDKIVLDSAGTGKLAEESGVTVSKNSKGQLVYTLTPLSEGQRNSLAFNTISTPNGGTYEVNLPDGSHVYLNAASSLKYPTAFAGMERKVTLIGEAYFEVTKNQNQPFIVSSSNQHVKVLGTRFNVTSYAGEAVKTTLAEGKVELSSPAFSQKSILKPGEQATASKAGFDIIKVSAEDVSAWKDGLFVFRATPLPAVLIQLSRWYDVEVGDIQVPNINFDGEISRDQPLSELLFVIQETSHVKLKIEGRRIVRQL